MDETATGSSWLNPLNLQLNKEYTPLIIDVTESVPKIPDRLHEIAERHNLTLKGEFHLSATTRKLDETHPELKRAVELLYLPLDRLPLKWLDEYYLGSRFYPESQWITVPHTRYSIVQRVEFPYLTALYQQFNLDFPGVLHVTLFVGSDNFRGTNWQQGIGEIKYNEMSRI